MNKPKGISLKHSLRLPLVMGTESASRQILIFGKGLRLLWLSVFFHRSPACCVLFDWQAEQARVTWPPSQQQYAMRWDNIFTVKWFVKMQVWIHVWVLICHCNACSRINPISSCVLTHFKMGWHGGERMHGTDIRWVSCMNWLLKISVKLGMLCHPWTKYPDGRETFPQNSMCDNVLMSLDRDLMSKCWQSLWIQRCCVKYLQTHIWGSEVLCTPAMPIKCLTVCMHSSTVQLEVSRIWYAQLQPILYLIYDLLLQKWRIIEEMKILNIEELQLSRNRDIVIPL